MNKIIENSQTLHNMISYLLWVINNDSTIKLKDLNSFVKSMYQISYKLESDLFNFDKN